MADEREVDYLDIEDLIALATMLLGDPPPIRDVGLLASAAARPQASVLGKDAYPDIWSKAAALLQSVVKSHPLVDRNERLGWLAAAIFLELNGVTTTRISNDDVYRFVMDVAAGNHEVGELATRLAKLVAPRHRRPIGR